MVYKAFVELGSSVSKKTTGHTWSLDCVILARVVTRRLVAMTEHFYIKEGQQKKMKKNETNHD
jgi:hypothetical protein